MTIRIADHDWLSAPTDTPANTRWEGLIDPSGFTIQQQLAWWPGGEEATQAATASVRLLDADGLLDAEALSDLNGAPVAIEQVLLTGTYAARTSIARFVVDKLVVESDARKTLQLRDAHDDLDAMLNPTEFGASVQGIAGKVRPAVIGAVANAPALLTGSDGSVGYLADAPVSVAVLRDRGDPMEAGTFTYGGNAQQLRLQSPPIGPMTADVSSIGTSGGQPTPATLTQAVRELMRRVGITAWSSADTAAIDAATGYAGIGYYAEGKQTARQALATILGSYGASYYQDNTGTLRFGRLVDPDGVAGYDFELHGSDLAEDLTFVNDPARALSTRMAWRPNARIMSESDFVTDLVDVPPALRQRLSNQYAGVVSASGSLPQQYWYAYDAEPSISLFWREQDAQAEVNRRAAMYGVLRRTYIAKVKGDTSFAPLPGQRCRLVYPRYGLQLGRTLLVRKVERNPATGDCTVYLWGQ